MNAHIGPRHWRCGRTASRVGIAAAAACSGMLVCATSATANNDPHRVFAGPPGPPVDVTGLCAFPVQIAATVDNEYAVVNSQPDGSILVVIRGSLRVTFTNDVTGLAIEVNASGPGMYLVTPDGSAVVSGTGLSILTAPNLTSFGFPSNIVVNSGPLQYIQTSSSVGPVSVVSGHINVVTDVCAALSSP